LQNYTKKIKFLFTLKNNEELGSRNFPTFFIWVQREELRSRNLSILSEKLLIVEKSFGKLPHGGIQMNCQKLGEAIKEKRKGS